MGTSALLLAGGGTLLHVLLPTLRMLRIQQLKRDMKEIKRNCNGRSHKSGSKETKQLAQHFSAGKLWQ